MRTFKLILKTWLPFAVVTTAFCLLVYATVQQVYRQNANDPQIQMAEDAAFALDDGAMVGQIVPTQKVDVSRSLAPFYLIFDATQKPVGLSGILNGDMPQLPDGVLDYAEQNGEHRLAWEPQSGVRIAAVIVPYKDGFVLAGRSLREVELRESQLATFTRLTWILALAAIFITISFDEWFLSEKQ
jgi:hypothetical protein